MENITKYLLKNKKLKHNALSYYSQFLGNAAIQIIFPFGMMLTWGADIFGIIIYLISIPSITSILILNFNSGTRQEMIQAKIQGKKYFLNSIYSNFIFITWITYIIFFLISIFIINYFQFDRLKFFLDSKEIKIFLYLLFASFFIKIIETIYVNKITYYGKFYIQKYMDIFSDIILKILMILVGFLTDLLLYLFLVYFIVILTKIIIYFYIGKNIKELKYDHNKINFDVIIFLYQKSKQYIFNGFDELIKNSLMPIIIGQFFDFRMVSFFTTVKTMFFFFPQKFFLILNEILQFDYIKLYYQKKNILLSKIFLKQNIITFLLLSLFLIFSFFFGKQIYNIWTNYYFNDININIIMYLTILECFFISFGVSLVTILKSFNKANLYYIISFILYALVSILSYYFYKYGFKFETLFALSLIASIITLVVSIFSLKFTLKYVKQKKIKS